MRQSKLGSQSWQQGNQLGPTHHGVMGPEQGGEEKEMDERDFSSPVVSLYTPYKENQTLAVKLFFKKCSFTNCFVRFMGLPCNLYLWKNFGQMFSNVTH